MRRWMRCNRWLSLVVLGFQAAVGAAAAAGTVGRYGLPAIGAAGPALLVIALPVLLWAIYWRRIGRGGTTRARWTAALVLALTASLVALATTPIGFTSGPGVGVLLSELARLTTVAHLQRSPTPTKIRRDPLGQPPRARPEAVSEPSHPDRTSNRQTSPT